MLNAPRASPSDGAPRRRAPTSCECTAWKRRRGVSGTIGISPRRTSGLGRNGPANSRRMPVAAPRLKISPGRRRTTRIAGCSASKRVEHPLDLGLVARVEQALDAAGRPALVDAAVLGARASTRRPTTRARPSTPRPRAAAVEDAAAAVDVDRAQLGVVARGLDQPRQVHDRVGARERRGEVVAGDVGGARSAPAGRRTPPAGARSATTSSTSGSAHSAATTLVPTLPVAPVTATRISGPAAAAP